VSFEIVMTTSVTRSCFTTQHHNKLPARPEDQHQDQDRFFLVWDRSCPKTDGLRPHHCSALHRRKLRATTCVTHSSTTPCFIKRWKFTYLWRLLYRISADS